MKTRFFKFVLPVFALLLAVSFAFATDSKPEVLTAYYYTTSGWQSTVASEDCNKLSGIPCKIGIYQLYPNMSFSDPLHRTAQ